MRGETPCGTYCARSCELVGREGWARAGALPVSRELADDSGERMPHGEPSADGAAFHSGIPREPEALQDFVENATVPIHWVGPDGTILWANRAELELLGYDRREYVGRPIAAFHVDAANIDEMLARLTRNEELHNHPARLRAKDGSIRHVLISSSVYRRDNQFIHTRCFTRDITDWKIADEARHLQLRRTERLNRIMAAIADAVTATEIFEAVVDRVALALDASSSGLWLVQDRKARLMRAKGYSEMARLSVESIALENGAAFPIVDSIRKGQPVWIASQADLVRLYPHLATISSQGRAYRVVCLPISSRKGIIGALGFTFDDNRPFDDEENAFLLLVARLTGQALERVHLLEAEHRHRNRAELLYRLAAEVNRADRVDQVFEAALDAIERASNTNRTAILAFDSEGVMRFRAWRGLSDRYRSAVEGHSPWSRDSPYPKPLMSGSVERDPSVAPYLPLFRDEGIEALAFIPLVSEGRLIGKLMIYYGEPHEFSSEDVEVASAIADHVAAALSRFDGVGELEKTVRFNEMFTGILAHDLRNPLNAIIMAARLATDWNQSDRLRRPLARILTSGARMTKMIDQLLDFTRIRLQGGIPLSPQPIDLAVVVRQSMDELEDANPGWSLRMLRSGDTVGLWDGDRLTQIFSNLVANAIQHGRQDWGIEVVVDGSGNNELVVQIQNMGVIPAELLPKLFEPLVGSARSLEHSSGLGLGLYITREIIRAHGGTIEVASDDPHGTMFVITLPRSLPS
jgi:PAS domain S-box-containing protein